MSNPFRLSGSNAMPSLSSRPFGSFGGPSFGNQLPKLQPKGKAGEASEYQEFAQVLLKAQDHHIDKTADPKIAPFIHYFEELCTAKAIQSTSDEEEYWRSESNTWLLLKALIEANEHPARASADSSKIQNLKYWSDLDIYERLASDNTFREHLAVKTWLEATAPETPTPQIPAGSRRAAPAFSFSGQSKDQYLDPDATFRENKALPNQDALREEKLLTAVWDCLRRGQLQKAKKICEHNGEPWRAESLSGGAFYTASPGFVGDLSKEEMEPEGNRTRSLWRATCYALAKETSVVAVERAIYGVLAGDYNSVLPVCQTWEDRAWAGYNALLEHMIEIELNSHGRGFPLAEMELPVIGTRGSPADILNGALGNTLADANTGGPKGLFRRIQTAVVTKRIPELFVKLAAEVRHAKVPMPHHVIRFLAHFVLLLRSRNERLVRRDADYLIQRYAEILVAKNLFEFVPVYVSYLPLEAQVATCSAYLKRVKGKKEERMIYLSALQKHGLYVSEILTATTNAMLKAVKDDGKHPVLLITARVSLAVDGSLTKTEEERIQALEWLTYQDTQYEECLYQATAVARDFLLRGRVVAMFELIRSLPQDLLGHIDHDISIADEERREAHEQEYKYYESLKRVATVFGQWTKSMGEKPSREYLHLGQYQTWKQAVSKHAEESASMIKDLLRDGWLSNAQSPAVRDEERNAQLNHIRLLFVPELVMTLHRVLFETHTVVSRFLEESRDLVNLVAEPATAPATALCDDLQSVNRLGEFVDLIHLSSTALINEGQAA